MPPRKKQDPPVMSRTEFIEAFSSKVDTIGDQLVEAYRSISDLRELCGMGAETPVDEAGDTHRLPELLNNTLSELSIKGGDVMVIAGNMQRTLRFFEEAT